MSIPRHALIPSITPRAARLPRGLGLWWPLHGSAEGMPDTPAATPLVVSGAASGTAWTADPMMYSFPTDNGGTNAVALFAAHDETDDSLESVLGLIGAAADTQLLIACTAVWGDQLDTFGYFWGYGQPSTHSFYSLGFNLSQALRFGYRGKEGPSNAELTPTLISGTASTDAGWLATDVRCVISIRVTGTTTADIEIRLGNGTLSAYYFNATLDWTGVSAPGRGSSTANQHAGFYIGGRGASGPTANLFLGKGAGHSARIGNVCARRFSDYDSGRALQAVTDLLARPDDYPESWLL